jgi:hypothetical protein
MDSAAPKWWAFPNLGIRESKEAGRFVYTKVNIRKGETILTENSCDLDDERQLDLYPANLDEKKDINRARDYNCFVNPDARTTDDDDVEDILVFPHTSLINHCCYPNAWRQITKNKEKGCYTIKVIAYDNIKAGSEVTISYLGLEKLMCDKRTRDMRLSHWFDSCRCSVCLDKELGSTRAMMRKLIGHLPFAKSRI